LVKELVEKTTNNSKAFENIETASDYSQPKVGLEDYSWGSGVPSTGHSEFFLVGKSGFRYFSCYSKDNNPRYDMYTAAFQPSVWFAILTAVILFCFTLKALNACANPHVSIDIPDLGLALLGSLVDEGYPIAKDLWNRPWFRLAITSWLFAGITISGGYIGTVINYLNSAPPPTKYPSLRQIGCLEDLGLDASFAHLRSDRIETVLKSNMAKPWEELRPELVRQIAQAQNSLDCFAVLSQPGWKTVKYYINTGDVIFPSASNSNGITRRTTSFRSGVDWAGTSGFERFSWFRLIHPSIRKVPLEIIRDMVNDVPKVDKDYTVKEHAIAEEQELITCRKTVFMYLEPNFRIMNPYFDHLSRSYRHQEWYTSNSQEQPIHIRSVWSSFKTNGNGGLATLFAWMMNMGLWNKAVYDASAKDSKLS